MMRKIGVVANCDKDEAVSEAANLLPWLKDQGKEVLLETELGNVLDSELPSLSREELPSEVDVIVLFGGDGTLLNVARHMHNSAAPLLGVNVGGLGFLTAVVPDELHATLEETFRSEHRVERRMMLACSVERAGGGETREYFALNDVVVSKEAVGRILQLDTYVDGDYLASYTCDGIIVSTPTGSTAHSLSAGGPIIYPTMEAIIINPICPHTLTIRPLVLAPQQTFKIVVSSDHEGVGLLADGQVGLALKHEDQVTVKKAPFGVNLVRPSTKNYFQVLHTKLKWGSR